MNEANEATSKEKQKLTNLQKRKKNIYFRVIT